MLKSENKHLKKEIGRITKQIKRYDRSVDQDREKIQEYEFVAATVDDGMMCPRCGEAVKPMDLGSRVLFNCDKCGHRKSCAKK